MTPLEVAWSALVREVGCRLENGEPFVVACHVANVTNTVISTESLTGANIEVRHARNESSMIMDKCGTRSSVVLHKFAKVPWLKLGRDDTVLDSDLRVAALGTRPMAIEEIDPEEERQTRLRKKETLGIDETMEVRKSHEIRVPEVPQIRSLSQMRHR